MVKSLIPVISIVVIFVSTTICLAADKDEKPSSLGRRAGKAYYHAGGGAPGSRPPVMNQRGCHEGTQISYRKEALMDAKYNWLIDSVAVRLTLNTVALAIWIAVSVGLLELAAKA